MITPDLKVSGPHPSMSEQLNSFVSDGSSRSMHSLIRNVSQGSNRHNFVGEVLIILSTPSSETCLKTVIFGGGLYTDWKYTKRKLTRHELDC